MDVTYQAIFERADDGTIWGRIPELEGAFGSGETIDAARASLEAAARLWIEEAHRDGTPIPAPSTVAIAAITVSAA